MQIYVCILALRDHIRALYWASWWVPCNHAGHILSRFYNCTKKKKIFSLFSEYFTVGENFICLQLNFWEKNSCFISKNFWWPFFSPWLVTNFPPNIVPSTKISTYFHNKKPYISPLFREIYVFSPYFTWFSFSHQLLITTTTAQFTFFNCKFDFTTAEIVTSYTFKYALHATIHKNIHQAHKHIHRIWMLYYIFIFTSIQTCKQCMG